MRFSALLWIGLHLPVIGAFVCVPKIDRPSCRPTALFVRPEDFKAGPIRPALPFRGFPSPVVELEEDPADFEEEEEEEEVVVTAVKAPEPVPVPEPVPEPIPEPEPEPEAALIIEEVEPEPEPKKESIFESEPEEVPIFKKVEPEPAPAPPAAKVSEPERKAVTARSATPASVPQFNIPASLLTSAPVLAIPILGVLGGALILRNRDRLQKEIDSQIEKRVSERKKEIEEQSNYALALFGTALVTVVGLIVMTSSAV